MIEYHQSVDSTNNRAKELARDGMPEGTAVVSREQTAGRGRLGRSFHSPEGQGLYFSLILRPDCPPARLMHLTCAVAVATCDAVSDVTGFRPGVKWINDLIAKNKKLGGILTELSVSPTTGLVEWAVVGIGINLCQTEFPPELSEIACSLAQITGSVPNPHQLTQALLERLMQMSQQLLSHQSDIMECYRRDCVTLGKRITVISPEPRQAIALDVADDGALLVDYGDGILKKVNAGEVSVRGLMGYA